MPTAKKKPTKTDIKNLEKKLKAQPRLVYDQLNQAKRKEAWAAAQDYKAFLDAAKTEREAVREILRRARNAGFKPLDQKKPGPKVVTSFMGKVAAAAVFGQKPLTDGLRLIVSHVDSPRLDLKPRPLYEDVNLGFLKSHYYGGIKKYQWLSRPLALHGFVTKTNGTTVELVVGEDPAEPVLTVADLLPHLSRKVQNAKKVSEAFPGEKLNLIAGCLPYGDDEVKERFKLGLLDLLDRRWGLVEDDFISAEFEAVPAGPARDVGLDAWLVGGYGQDDRICAYASLAALLDVDDPPQTTVALFMDKEEIGSEGATGADSRYIEGLVADLLESRGQGADWNSVRKTLMNTRAVSADVEGALDPDYQEVHEQYNAARLGHGPCLTKYTGGGGKYGASEASSEYLGWLRGVLDRDGVVWQPALLGKIDEGGGGTVALFLARYAMEIVDMGPALLGMHSPFEIAAKTDLYMTVQAYRAFYQAR
jgi:aspartyl aminopeptidase